MNIELIKKFLDACHQAKKITELMPELPIGIKPRHIHVIDVISRLSTYKEYVKVTDVSRELKVTKPSVTKLISELEANKVLVKRSSCSDKRIITLELTALGKKYYDIYVYRYQKWLSELFVDINEKDIAITGNTVEKCYEIMKSNNIKD